MARRIAIRLAAAAVCALLILLIAACGGDSNSSSTGSPDDTYVGFNACTLLPKDELETVIGLPQDGRPSKESPHFDCLWYSEDTNFAVTLSVYNESSEDAIAAYDQATGDQNLDGLGDKAKWSEPDTTLAVLKGNDAVTIRIITSHRTYDLKTAATQLAQIAVSHLSS